MAKKRYDTYGRMKKASFYRKKKERQAKIIKSLKELAVFGNSKCQNIHEYENEDAIFDQGYFPDPFNTELQIKEFLKKLIHFSGEPESDFPDEFMNKWAEELKKSMNELPENAE